MEEQLATQEQFKAAVELWENKGHKNVVEVRFEGNKMIMLVQDYVMPDVVYYIAAINCAV
jgi:major membrane immunogen (membrane-anchored lipoprotein)